MGININDLKIILENEHGYLKDLGNRIGLIEFKSKGNSVSIGVRHFINDVLENHQDLYDGLVIGNDSKHYSVGANVAEIKEKILKEDFDGFRSGVQNYQELMMKIKYFHKPIVSAPYKMTLGGGLELVMHTHKSVALNKAYFGLVEVGIGLIPGGGGIKESLVRAYQLSEDKEAAAIQVFKNLLSRKVSSNALEAKIMNYLRAEDGVETGQENLISEAKDACLLLVNDVKEKEVDRVLLMKSSFKEKLLCVANELFEKNEIYPYDLEIAETLAEIICGPVEAIIEVSENELLEREREGFVKQTKNKKTLERISHLLETGQLLLS